MTPEQTAGVRALNDAFRTSFAGGRVMVTQGVQAEGMIFQMLAAKKVAEFTDFSDANDPHGEHDFGCVEVQGSKVFWKIDVYADGDYLMGSEAPWEEGASARVLTIMLSSEY